MTHVDTPTPNDLGRIVTSPAARQAIYGIYVIALLGVGAATVGFAALSTPLPEWGVVANAVLGYLGIPVGGLAIANTPVKG